MKVKRDVIKYAGCIALAALIIVVLAYALFLLEHILIIYPAVHILPLAVITETAILLPMCIFYLYRYFRNKGSYLPVLILILLLWLTPQVSFIAYVEYEYDVFEEDYTSFVSEKTAAGGNETDISWDISKRYLKTFQSSQNDIRIPVPVRCIYAGNSVLEFNILLNYYFFEMDGLLKLMVIDKRGNCSEFAGAVTYLVNRTQKSTTRVGVIYGYDHKIAEVKTDSGWLILDPLKTTPDYPVEISGYAKQISSLFPEMSGRIISIKTDKGEDITAEHGF